MQIVTHRRVPALLAVAAAAIAAIAPTTPAIAAPTPTDATASALLDAFATHQIVALGQVHDLRQEDDFILDLLHHPRFAETVDTIVVEFGTPATSPASTATSPADTSHDPRSSTPG